ncbi:MAG: hypothetical protein QXS41_03840 [Candidatus Woesearchaeota archaeon]
MKKILSILLLVLLFGNFFYAYANETNELEEIIISLKELYYYKIRNEFIKSFQNRGLFSIFDSENLVIYAKVGKLIRLNISNYDPDNDNVSIIFSKPFNKDGTFYVSKEGNYYGKIILFDGKDYTEIDVKIIAIDVDMFPTLICKDIQVFSEGEKAKLDCTFSPEGGKIIVSGFFNNLEKTILYNESGEYSTKVTYCTTVCIEKEIKIIVKDINRPVEIIKKNDTLIINQIITNEKELLEAIIKNYDFIDPDNDEISKDIKLLTKIKKIDFSELDNKKLKILINANDAKDNTVLEDEILIIVDKKVKEIFSEENYEILENQELNLNYEFVENLLLKEIISNVDVEILAENSSYKLKIKPNYETVNQKIILPFLRPSIKESIKLIFDYNNHKIVKKINLKILDVNRLPILENKTVFNENEKFYFIAYDDDSLDVKHLRSKLISLDGKCNLKYFSRIPYFCSGEYSAKIEVFDRLDKVTYDINFSVISSKFKNLKMKEIKAKENETITLKFDKLFNYKNNFKILDLIDEYGNSLKNYNLTIVDDTLIFKPYFDISTRDLNAIMIFEFENNNLSWRELLPVKIINVNRKPQFDLKVNRSINKNNIKTLFVEIIAWDEDKDNLEIWSIVNGKKITGNKFKVVYSTKIPEIEIFVSDEKEITKKKVRIG